MFFRTVATTHPVIIVSCALRDIIKIQIMIALLVYAHLEIKIMQRVANPSRESSNVFARKVQKT